MEGNSYTFFRGLSSQLLMLTILFVMVVQVFIYIPSLAQFRKNFLDQRLAAAQIAILSLEEADEEGVSPMLEQELLEVSEIQAVIVISEEARRLALSSTLPESLTGRFDLRNPGLLELTKDAFMTFQRKGVGSIQIQGDPINPRYQSIQVVLAEKPLYLAMVDFSRSIFFSSLVISFFTGVLIFASIHFLTVRPTKRITRNLTRFEKAPEAKANILKASGRKNEIGLLEDQITHMQQGIQGAMKQKTHLANLGLAVSKINHDLRNILATAQLSVDLLSRKNAAAPQQKTIDRLYRAVDRAAKLCERTLRYGRADEPAPEKEILDLKELIVDACRGFQLDEHKDLELVMNIPNGYKIFADKEQFYRIITNLCRNAVQAMGNKGRLTISTEAAKRGQQKIRLSDTGPGVPEELHDTLFIPFAGTSKLGGSGLGLAIAHGLAQDHGGDLVLEETSPNGTVFCISLPVKKD